MLTATVAFTAFVLGFVIAQAIYSSMLNSYQEMLNSYQEMLNSSRKRADEYYQWYKDEQVKADRYYTHWLSALDTKQRMPHA